MTYQRRLIYRVVHCDGRDDSDIDTTVLRLPSRQAAQGYKRLAEAALADARAASSRIFRIAVAHRSSGVISSGGAMRDVALAAADPGGVVIVWRALMHADREKISHRAIVATLVPGGEDYFDRRGGQGKTTPRRESARLVLVREFERRIADIGPVDLLAELDE